MDVRCPVSAERIGTDAWQHPCRRERGLCITDACANLSAPLKDTSQRGIGRSGTRHMDSWSLSGHGSAAGCMCAVQRQFLQCVMSFSIGRRTCIMRFPRDIGTTHRCTMRQSETTFHPSTIESPRCEICDAPMWLASIEPDQPAHDRRNFECPRCQHVMIKICKYK